MKTYIFLREQLSGGGKIWLESPTQTATPSYVVVDPLSFSTSNDPLDLWTSDSEVGGNTYFPNLTPPPLPTLDRISTKC